MSGTVVLPGVAQQQIPQDAAVLRAGAGFDTVTAGGPRASFNVERHDGYVVVSSVAAPASKTVLVNVEQIQFTDVTEAVTVDAALLTLAGVYQTALGRQADLEGFAYWGQKMHTGASWGGVALGMIGSPESVALHGAFNGQAAHDVELLYGTLFNRHSDAEGLAFWTGVVERGVALEVVADEMMHSVEMVGHQRPATDWNFFV